MNSISFYESYTDAIDPVLSPTNTWLLGIAHLISSQYLTTGISAHTVKGLWRLALLLIFLLGFWWNKVHRYAKRSAGAARRLVNRNQYIGLKVQWKININIYTIRGLIVV